VSELHRALDDDRVVVIAVRFVMNDWSIFSSSTGRFFRQAMVE
jgi:hypothetical protein